MTNEKTYLTPHFSLEELAATRHPELQDAPSAACVKRLTTISQVLERLREHLGTPIRISSGYRSKALNARVGGSPRSYHLLGAAVDIRVESLDTACKVMATLSRICPDFDELIMESHGGIIDTVHFALLRSGKPRQYVSYLVFP